MPWASYQCTSTRQPAPTPRAERLAQAGKLVYSATDCNRYDFFDLADNLKVFSHPLIPRASTNNSNPIRREASGDAPRHK
jgi:hypothetical protein